FFQSQLLLDVTFLLNTFRTALTAVLSQVLIDRYNLSSSLHIPLLFHLPLPKSSLQPVPTHIVRGLLGQGHHNNKLILYFLIQNTLFPSLLPPEIFFISYR